MINVAFFSNQFADARGHGIARYARELHAALVKLNKAKIVPVSAWSSLSQSDLSEQCKSSGLRISPLGRRLTPLAWNYLKYPTIERLLNEDFDVVHAVSLGYPIATKKPLIVTIHDLGPLVHPEYFKNTWPWIMKNSLRQAQRQADIIICVSQSTADEVCGYLGDGIADRIRVVYEGVAPEFFEPTDLTVLEALSLPGPEVPIILTAGKMSPRKNIQGVLRAMSLIRRKIPHHLVIVGGKGWDMKEVLDNLAVSDLSRRVHLLDYVTDEQLRALYRRASLYVHPSLYEGFGLTILEAMASETPVVTSNRSSLPEVAGSAACLVDPENTNAMADAIGEICLNGKIAASLARAGKRRATNFSWNDCANAVLRAYRDII